VRFTEITLHSVSAVVLEIDCWRAEARSRERRGREKEEK
jgi:hypothetical protein